MDVCRVDSEALVRSEFDGIARRLESFHELFRALWDIGEPRFTDTVETAAIVFGADGAPLRFLFNRDFWKSLPAYDRQFVVCHEMLHAVLNHGFRGMGFENQAVANVAADIAINHLLVDRFGFCRELLRDWRSLCWVDTVFTNRRKPLPAAGLTFEEYYALCIAESEVVLAKLVDEHRFEPTGGGSLRNPKAATEMDSMLADLGPFLGAELLERLGAEASVQAHRGTQSVGAWCSVMPVPPAKIRWEEVIRRRLRGTEGVRTEGWVMPARQYAHQNTFILPGTMEAPGPKKDRLQRCVFFLDASGSTWGFRDRFFALARSLPPSKFQVELCSFDTSVYPLKLDKPQVRGGGGTSFKALEAWLSSRLRDTGGRTAANPRPYPDVVIVLTDGQGDFVEPRHPERWHWLLTIPETSCVPKGSVPLRLTDFG